MKKETLEIGTDEIRKAYSEDTPGQMVDSYIMKDQKTKKENATLARINNLCLRAMRAGLVTSITSSTATKQIY